MAPSTFPEILVLCMHDQDIQALNTALHTKWPAHAQSVAINIVNDYLRDLPSETRFDLIVSPSNSYGLLDGGFDDAISRSFCLPHHDYRSLTTAAQQKLYDQWRGFAPPGSCTLVTIPSELQNTNRWRCKYLALCPTMRTPSDARWNREVVYECVWSLMCEVDRFNNSDQAQQHDKIQTILITPLATGAGRVSVERWAVQFVLALKHFADALARPERWGSLHWGDIKEAFEVEETWKNN